MFGLILFAAQAHGAVPMKAGLARVDITPSTPITLSGYGNRTHPSEGVWTRLWAKALAIEDAKGGRVVIVTTDLIGLTRAITDAVSARAAKEHGLDRSRVVFNSSHTHNGPMVWGNLPAMFVGTAEEERVVRDYTQDVAEKLFALIGAALSDLAPAEIAVGHGEVGFGYNRRNKAVKPVDHDVPVIRVTSTDGKLRGVLFAYACHNTTLVGEMYAVAGDYAGFAQQEFEEAHPGVVGMFMQLCGGDQNPNPRGKLEHAKQHGRALAAEVSRVIGGEMEPVAGSVRTAFQVTELNFKPHTREQFEADLTSKLEVNARRAKLMLKAYDERRPIRRVPYPVQAIGVGKKLTLVALGGEVVVDYQLNLKKEFAKTPNLIVAGYSNDVMCYIPTARILKEGGYEAEGGMPWYGQPGPLEEAVEETVMEAARRTLRRVGVRPAK